MAGALVPFLEGDAALPSAGRLDPRLSVMTDLGLSFRDAAPVAVRNDPSYLAVWHAQARECERLAAAIEQVRAQAFPQLADVLLKVWETQVGTTVEPSGQTVAQRRATVLALLREAEMSPAGRDWRERVTRLIGPSWTYTEHDPGDPSSPPEGTVRLTVPFPPDSDLYGRLERMIENDTPSHIGVELSYDGGFLLDVSQLDDEGLA